VSLDRQGAVAMQKCPAERALGEDSCPRACRRRPVALCPPAPQCRLPSRWQRWRLLPFICCRSAQAAEAAAWALGVAPESGLGPQDSAARWQSALDAELFWSQGYLHIPRFASSAEVAGLRSAMAALLNAWDPPTAATSGSVGSNASVSSLRATGGGSSQERDHTFLMASATKSSFFLDPSAVVIAGVGALKPGLPKHRAVRKVGHGLHLADGPVRDFVRSPKMARLAMELGWRRPVVVQSAYRFAPPLSAGVDRHQDSTTLYTEPPTCLGIWLALEDAGETNSCLRVRSGSHHEPIRERLVRQGDDGDVGSGGVQLVFDQLASPFEAPDTAFLPLHTASGDLVVMHGALEHFSARGLNPNRSRESLQVHIVEADAQWSPANWLQYPPGLEFMPLAPLPASQPLRVEL